MRWRAGRHLLCGVEAPRRGLATPSRLEALRERLSGGAEAQLPPSSCGPSALPQDAHRLRGENGLQDAHDSGSARSVQGRGGRGSTERLPEWLKVKVATGAKYAALKESLAASGLHTVCQEAKCPNIGECWSGETATATIMIMGDECTRACRFCSVKTARAPRPLDAGEPARVAREISRWRGEYVVITSVDRDDLADGGAAHFAETVRCVREASPRHLVECLTGDFGGALEGVALVARAGLHVYAHSVETVERLTPAVRDRRASYRQSLRVLAAAKAAAPWLVTKSSLMLGVGETDEEVRRALADLRAASVDAVTLGQYMRPTRGHMPVAAFVAPARFDDWRRVAREEFGFSYVAAGPLVRSSYRAGELYMGALVAGRIRSPPPPP